MFWFNGFSFSFIIFIMTGDIIPFHRWRESDTWQESGLVAPPPPPPAHTHARYSDQYRHTVSAKQGLLLPYPISACL